MKYFTAIVRMVPFGVYLFYVSRLYNKFSLAANEFVDIPDKLLYVGGCLLLVAGFDIWTAIKK